MNESRLENFVTRRWREDIVSRLCEYIEIPNQSPSFDPAWREHGHMDRATELIANWIQAQGVPGLTLDVLRDGDRTPLLFAEIPGTGTETVLLYGHLDKQPPFDGWNPGLSPWTPVIREGRLYGRGAADDGYSAFAAITAIAALAEQGLPYARCVVLIEACEESGSPDLPHYLRMLRSRIGRPSLVIGLDSGCGDYERLWVTTSLRGLVNGDLSVSVLRDGVHSGNGGGIVPSSFRVIRHLLERVEDSRTGEVLLPEAQVPISSETVDQARAAAAVLGFDRLAEYPFAGSTTATTDDPTELILNRTWRPQLEVIGAAGLPELDRAGNVLRPNTTLRLSLRLPPTADSGKALKALRTKLEAEPPYGAAVELRGDQFGANGWSAPPIAPWLADAVSESSRAFFGKEPCYMGEGGTIPFMAMLGEMFPEAQFLITGVLGPKSNAHGPNEFLDLATAERLTSCVANVLYRHASRR